MDIPSHPCSISWRRNVCQEDYSKWLTTLFQSMSASGPLFGKATRALKSKIKLSAHIDAIAVMTNAELSGLHVYQSTLAAKCPCKTPSACRRPHGARQSNAFPPFSRKNFPTMSSMWDAYRRAMAKKGAEMKKLKAANAAFGSQSARLMALYGPSNQTTGTADETSQKEDKAKRDRP